MSPATETKPTNITTKKINSDSQEAFDMRIDFFMDEVDGLVKKIVNSENPRREFWKIDSVYEELIKSNFLTDTTHRMYVVCYANMKAGNYGLVLEVYHGMSRED